MASTPSSWSLALYAVEWLIRILALFVVPFRRTPDAAKGWLLLIFFMPFAGLLLYLVIGRPRLPRWRVAMMDRLVQALEPMRQRMLKDPHLSTPKLPPSLGDAAKLAANLGHLRPLGGNSAEVLVEYDRTVDRLVADIDAAQSHVHLLFYIFADDATGRRVLDALRRAAARGVRCRVLFDAMGSRRWARGLRAAVRGSDVELHAVLPVGLFRRKAGRIDLRNHRKIAIIDGRTGYTGSQNLIDATFKRGITYEDLVVRLTGPVVIQLQAVFAADWFLETAELLDTPDVFLVPETTGQVTAQGLPSGPIFSTSNLQPIVVAMVHGARDRIVIVTPYFIPDLGLLQALQTAVLRGVAVHLVFSKVADQALVWLAQRSYYEELLESGVQVHLYQDKLLHAKFMTVDADLALIGSSNIDIRSFVLNEEFSVLFYDRATNARLTLETERYFAESKQLDSVVWRERSRLGKTAEALARMMSPLL